MNETARNALLLGAAGASAMALGRQILRRRRAIEFAGKTALVTGGSRGLGFVLARTLAAQGAKVAICARDQAELDRALEQLHPISGEVFGRACDVGDHEQVEQLMEAVRERFGAVDLLFNNAGVIQTGPAEVMTLDDFEQAMRVHLWGPLYTMLAVLPEMRRRRAGRIVNIASIGGKISAPHLLPYCASKFALVGLSRGLGAEAAKDGVRVTTVAPGLMRTGSPRNALFKGKHRAEYAWFSISDSLPGISIDAERAAHQILRACRYGDSELVISVPAKLAVLLDALAPGLIDEAMAVTNRLLPAPGGIGERAVRGFESESPWSPSWLTSLTEKAAARFNEIGPGDADAGPNGRV